MTKFGAWIRNKINQIIHPNRARVWYRVEFSGEYNYLTKYETFDRVQRVDTQDRNSVYYMFHVYLTDPSVKIYVEWNDGTCQEVCLGKVMKIKEES